MDALPKPWFDLRRYVEARLKEARYEAELAREFLKMGLYRNAAGKAFQAWKAVVAARAAERIEDVRRAFPGSRRLRGSRRRVEKAYWIAAVMPTSLLKPVSQIVGGEISLYTNIALWLHEYQYNGPDPQGVLSPYPSDEYAKMDIEALLEAVEKLTSVTP
ncbi:MAG: hypothetical protein JZD41_02965 [Thermoproteus sp.]|nr:hypothetical protein [Thermoproteus sp.]